MSKRPENYRMLVASPRTAIDGGFLALRPQIDVDESHFVLSSELLMRRGCDMQILP